MTRLDIPSAITALFIFGMIWLRTRMQYVGAARAGADQSDISQPGGDIGRRGRRLQLERTGRVYFACAVALLVLGWAIAPTIGAMVWPASAANPPLTRVIWFLSSYYVFILVHRYLKSRGVAVFKVALPKT